MDTGHSKGLSEGVEGGSPGDLPGGDVRQNKAKLVQQVPHLRIQRTKKKKKSQEGNVLSTTEINCGAQTAPNEEQNEMSSYYLSPRLMGTCVLTLLKRMDMK